MPMVLIYVIVLLVSYLLGSIPSGLLIVKLRTGKDIRQVESGRTGGTNAMRAAGAWAGVATAFADMLKGAIAVWIARWVSGGNVWLEVIAPVIAILGHNYSIFLMERDENGRIRLRGGAGGATAVGGSFGLWFPSLFIIVPLGAAVWYFGGFASVATMSAALLSTIIFAIRAAIGASPWEYALYGLLAEAVLVWALRPNIRRLLNGTERVVGFRARHKKKNRDNHSPSSPASSSS